MTTTWKQVRRGDVIACPADGTPEKVTETRAAGVMDRGARRFVRTDRHDHTRPAGEQVTRLLTAAEARRNAAEARSWRATP